MNETETESVRRDGENFPGAELSEDEIEFALAMHHYQKVRGRRFPAWREVLAVLRALGYRKVPLPPSPPLRGRGVGGEGALPEEIHKVHPG